MPTHNIHIGIKTVGIDKHTTTAFPVSKNDHVIFHNKGNAMLTVRFDDPAGPLCDNQGNAKNPIEVGAGLASAKWKVCKGKGGDQFAYTAQIAGTIPEDPIVIIEGGYDVPLDTILMFVGGAVIGALITIVLMKLKVSRTRPMT